MTLQHEQVFEEEARDGEPGAVAVVVEG
jgi:hypothetical protein